jgi:hypothetical protein
MGWSSSLVPALASGLARAISTRIPDGATREARRSCSRSAFAAHEYSCGSVCRIAGQVLRGIYDTRRIKLDGLSITRRRRTVITTLIHRTAKARASTARVLPADDTEAAGTGVAGAGTRRVRSLREHHSRQQQNQRGRHPTHSRRPQHGFSFGRRKMVLLARPRTRSAPLLALGHPFKLLLARTEPRHDLDRSGPADATRSQGRRDAPRFDVATPRDGEGRRGPGDGAQVRR